MKKEYETLWLNVVLFQEDLVRTSDWGGVEPSPKDENELEPDWQN